MHNSPDNSGHFSKNERPHRPLASVSARTFPARVHRICDQLVKDPTGSSRAMQSQSRVDFDDGQVRVAAIVLSLDVEDRFDGVACVERDGFGQFDAVPRFVRCAGAAARRRSATRIAAAWIGGCGSLQRGSGASERGHGSRDRSVTTTGHAGHWG